MLHLLLCIREVDICSIHVCISCYLFHENMNHLLCLENNFVNNFFPTITFNCTIAVKITSLQFPDYVSQIKIYKRYN